VTKLTATVNLADSNALVVDQFPATGVVMATMTVGTTVMNVDVVHNVDLVSLHVPMADASQLGGNVMVTMTVETIATRPTVTRRRSKMGEGK